MRALFALALSAGVMTCCAEPVVNGVHAYTPKGYVPPTEKAVRERLEWFKDQKLGLMMHWGLYSLLSVYESWPLCDVAAKWSRKDIDWVADTDAFKREYRSMIRAFCPTRFEPEKWAALAAESGFKYLVFTTKHHDGFCLFDSKYSDFKVTSPECPFSSHPKADVVRQVFDAFRARGLAVSAYFSKPDWNNEDYWEDHGIGRQTTTYPTYDVKARPEKWARFREYTRNQILELVRDYGRIDMLWLDGGDVRKSNGLDIDVEGIVAEARKTTPDLLVADRTCGGPCENVITPEQEVPERPIAVPWESCVTLTDNWGFRYDDRYKSLNWIIHTFLDVVAKGGNLALDVPPAPDGRLPAPAVERLRGLGAWMRKNGEGIYATRPVAPFASGKWRFTAKGDVAYAFELRDGGEGNPKRLPLPPGRVPRVIRHLATGKEIPFRREGDGVVLGLPGGFAHDPDADGYKIEFAADEKVPATVVAKPRVENKWAQGKHEEDLSDIARGPRRYDFVLLGDSITDNWDKGAYKSFFGGVRPLGQEVAKRAFAPYRWLNLGIGGDGTENVLWRIEHGALDGYETPLFGLMIGTNNRGASAEDVAVGVMAIVKRIRARHPSARILLTPILPRFRREDDPGDMNAKNRQTNDILRRSCDGDRLVWFDWTHRLLRPDGSPNPDLYFDREHLAQPGYEIWAEELLRHVNGRTKVEAPGHVFAAGESVRVTGGVSGTGWTLFDWRGRLLRRGNWPESRQLEWNDLGMGYYRLSDGASFAVVPAEARPVAPASFFGMDTAQSWCARKGSFLCPWLDGDTFRLVSDLVARAGIGHVRDRLGWGDVEPTPGARVWGDYRRNAELLHERGVGVSGMFHDTPNCVAKLQKLPRDLAALHRFSRDAAAAFKGRMEDWEFWNEPDIVFAPESVWDYASALKAASLGFRIGCPGVPVLPGALCVQTRNSYDEGLYLNDVAKYTDVFNYHTYAPIRDYPKIFGDLRAFMARFGIADRAIWITESGTDVEGVTHRPSVMAGRMAHTDDQELVHAEFYAKSQVYLQMEGIARNYLFAFTPINEREQGTKDWGVMRSDGTVKPTYAAISSIIHAIGSAEPEGEVPLGEGLKGFAYRHSDGTRTLAFWSVSAVETEEGGVRAVPDAERKFELSASDGSYRLTDLCGSCRSVAATNGLLRLTASRFPSYLSGMGKLPLGRPARRPGRIGRLPVGEDEDLTLVFRAEPKGGDFVVGRRKSLADLERPEGCIRVTLWNLDRVEKTGKVQASGGRFEGIPESLTVPAMGEVSFDCTYRPPEDTAVQVGEIAFSGIFAGRRTSRLVIPVRFPGRALAAMRRQELGWRNVSAWRANSSARECRVTWDAEADAMRFDMTFDETCADRWFYPFYDLNLPDDDISGARILEFEVRSVQDRIENAFAQQFVMLGFGKAGKPARHIPYAAPVNAWERRRVELTPETGETVAGVRTIQVGAHPVGCKCTFWVRKLTALRP